MSARHDRLFRQRNYRCIVPRGWRPPSVEVPADVVILDRDPSPCWMCETRADVGCRHRSAA